MRSGLEDRRFLAGAVLAAMLLAACSGTDGSPAASTGATPEPGALVVVATTTIFADLVEQVGGSNVVVHSVVPKGGEVHTFDPTPTDARRVADADLILMNGLGLDAWLADLAIDAGATAPTIALAEDLPDVEYITNDGGAVNPHLWLDVSLAAAYVERIVSALATADPGDAAAYRSGGAAYLERLAELDTWVKTRFDEVPEANRRVVSFHDAFPYFGAAYGLEIVDTVVDAPGQDPSAGDMADLVEAIREAGVSAILSEAQFNVELAQTIADETGAEVVSELYTDSVGDSPIDSYEAVTRWNTDRIVAAIS